MPKPSDATLIARARDGDHGAFECLVERYADQVAGVIIGMLGAGPEADDVGQETFIRFYEALDQFRGEASVGTYLTRIAINEALRASRRRTVWYRRFLPEAEAPEPAHDGRGDYEVQERSELVRRALQQIDEKHRAVVVLRMLEEYSTKETADLLDIPQGTVMSRLSRALDKLEPLLAPFIPADEIQAE